MENEGVPKEDNDDEFQKERLEKEAIVFFLLIFGGMLIGFLTREMWLSDEWSKVPTGGKGKVAIAVGGGIGALVSLLYWIVLKIATPKDPNEMS